MNCKENKKEIERLLARAAYLLQVDTARELYSNLYLTAEQASILMTEAGDLLWDVEDLKERIEDIYSDKPIGTGRQP